jgi:hypothetical protein
LVLRDEIKRQRPCVPIPSSVGVPHGFDNDTFVKLEERLEGSIIFRISVGVADAVPVRLKVIEGMGSDTSEVDVVRLTPLKWAQINMLGRYESIVSPDVLDGYSRPLCDPNVGMADDLAARLIASAIPGFPLISVHAASIQPSSDLE